MNTMNMAFMEDLLAKNLFKNENSENNNFRKNYYEIN